MKHVALFALAMLAAAPAAAQPSLSTYAQLGPYYSNTVQWRDSRASDICLRRIRTGAVVCHSRDEWRQFAARMARPR